MNILTPTSFLVRTFALAVASLVSSASSATILDPKVYVGIADGGLVGIAPAAEYINYNHIGDWSSMSGGEMIVSIAPGQSVFSATMSAAWAFTPEELETAEYSKVWNFSFSGAFPEQGADPGDELWRETGHAGSSPYWWQPTGSYGVFVYVKFKYEALTSEGLVVDDNGGTGYFGFVPEPNSAALTLIPVPFLLRRRRG